MERYLTQAPPEASIPQYLAGDPVPTALDIEYSEAERTVLIAVQTHCPACNASLAFYRSLIDRRDADGADVKFVMVGSDSDTELAKHLSSNNILADRLIQVPSSDIPGIRVTPTLLIVDDSGTIIHTYTSALDADSESALVKQLFGAPFNAPAGG